MEDVEIKTIGEEGREPLQCHHTRHVKVFFEMLLQTRELVFDEEFNNLLVDPGPEQVLEVVDWHQVLYDARERPERLFLCHDLEEASNDEVEALAVPDVYVAECIRRADALNGVQDFLA